MYLFFINLVVVVCRYIKGRINVSKFQPLFASLKRTLDGYERKLVVRGIDTMWMSGNVHAVTTATWTPSQGLKLTSDEIFTETYNNFEGYQLKVAIKLVS